MAVDGEVRDDECGCVLQLAQPLLVLDAALVAVIDRYLAEITGYGEVRLKIERGRVRFVEVAVSLDVQKVTAT